MHVSSKTHDLKTPYRKVRAPCDKFQTKCHKKKKSRLGHLGRSGTLAIWAWIERSSQPEPVRTDTTWVNELAVGAPVGVGDTWDGALGSRQSSHGSGTGNEKEALQVQRRWHALCHTHAHTQKFPSSSTRTHAARTTHTMYTTHTTHTTHNHS